jgi:hydrophobic/amphiphilic exporter-1 (mainly G- bacteria), HAE1 family
VPEKHVHQARHRLFFTSFSLGLTYWLMPSAEYLPQGNRNLILNIMIPPPGYSVDKLKEMGKTIYRETEPYFKEDGKDSIPQINQMFYVGADRINLFGGLSVHETRAREMMPLFNRIIHSFPGMFGVSIQASILSRASARDGISMSTSPAKTLTGSLTRHGPCSA